MKNRARLDTLKRQREHRPLGSGVAACARPERVTEPMNVVQPDRPADGGAHRYLRIGACAALVGIAVQSIWEAGLRAPANLLLAAIVAAIAVRPIERADITPTSGNTPA